MLYLNYEENGNKYIPMVNLTLTSVVFEWWRNKRQLGNIKNLTLTSVVFELWTT